MKNFLLRFGFGTYVHFSLIFILNQFNTDFAYLGFISGQFTRQWYYSKYNIGTRIVNEYSDTMIGGSREQFFNDIITVINKPWTGLYFRGCLIKTNYLILTAFNELYWTLFHFSCD